MKVTRGGKRSKTETDLSVIRYSQTIDMVAKKMIPLEQLQRFPEEKEKRREGPWTDLENQIFYQVLAIMGIQIENPSKPLTKHVQTISTFFQYRNKEQVRSHIIKLHVPSEKKREQQEQILAAQMLTRTRPKNKQKHFFEEEANLSEEQYCEENIREFQPENYMMQSHEPRKTRSRTQLQSLTNSKPQHKEKAVSEHLIPIFFRCFYPAFHTGQ